MGTYPELRNRSIFEAQEDLRRFNDPTSLSYNDNWVAEALFNKYGMDAGELGEVVKNIIKNNKIKQGLK